MPGETTSTAKPVCVTLDQLVQGNVTDQILMDAFGPGSLGIIIVTDMDETYMKLRKAVLSSATKLASLPEDVLQSLERPDGYWLTGWSLGKEKLENGQPDNNKASYYVNCCFYRDAEMEAPDAETVAKYCDMKGYTTPNAWPPEPSIPGFQRDLKQLITRIIDVSLYVAKLCDRYMLKQGYDVGISESDNQANSNYLEKMVMSSNTTKARLLHYIPQPPTSDTNGISDDGNWCGEHFDHSCLTALTSNMYMDAADLTKEAHLPDDLAAEAGLFIRDRHHKLVKVDIPQNALAFQTGSALEELTKGKFKAVSHLVRGAPNNHRYYRNTLAVFCQPSLQDKVSADMSFAEYSRAIVERHH